MSSFLRVGTLFISITLTSDTVHRIDYIVHFLNNNEINTLCLCTEYPVEHFVFVDQFNFQQVLTRLPFFQKIIFNLELGTTWKVV